MQGLYYAIEQSEYMTLHLLRFYNESSYVIFKSIKGDKADYFRKELSRFKMEGHVVKGEPEFTFCGAFDESGDKLWFKVENEITNPSDSWVQKDVISFTGSILNENELELKQVSKRSGLETSRVYLGINDEQLLEKLKEVIA
jgi:hypothetical protein